MKRLLATAFVAIGLTMTAVSANAMTPAPLAATPAIGSDVIQVRGGHGHGHGHMRGGGRGHHYGWHRGRGHHYGWSRGHHRGWARHRW
jgi:hypothetical protein